MMYADIWDNYRDDPNVLIVYYEHLVRVSTHLLTDSSRSYHMLYHQLSAADILYL